MMKPDGRYVDKSAKRKSMEATIAMKEAVKAFWEFQRLSAKIKKRKNPLAMLNSMNSAMEAMAEFKRCSRAMAGSSSFISNPTSIRSKRKRNRKSVSRYRKLKPPFYVL